MKKILTLFFSIAIALFFTGNTIAQEKPKTEMTSVKQKDGTVRINLTSSKPFIFANNRYVLYVGLKQFTRYEQTKKDGKGHISFLLDKDEFNNLIDGAYMYLSYGDIEVENTDMGQLAKESPRCWSLGVFSKSLLK